MFDWFSKLDIKLQSGLISSGTSIIIFLVGWLIKVFYERNSLKYKLKKEYEYEQKRKLKEDIAKTKISLLNIVEELDHRLSNFNDNVSKGWHIITKTDWEQREKYYTRSFVYRFLVFIHWTLKTEKETLSIDTTIADKNDIVYLKYIKTFKDIFSEPKLLAELNYSNEKNTNHFYKNDLVGYSKYILEDDRVIDFDEFSVKTKDKYCELEKIITYFSSIKNDPNDKNLNTLRCFHLLIISFLNRYGHTYQHSEKSKVVQLKVYYANNIQTKKGFKEFINKSKLEKEMKKYMI